VALAVPVYAAARTQTAETVFQPFTAAGIPTLQTTSKSGYCYTGSLAVNRSDAWRCFVGNFILDPCFSSPRVGGEVVCPGINLSSGIEIRLTKPLPTGMADPGKPSLRHEPWDIQLADGVHFLLSSGASNVVDGKRLNYFCGPKCSVGLWGYPRRSTEPWTILVAPVNAKSLHARQAIRHVWM
jgi:hypothetical protein